MKSLGSQENCRTLTKRIGKESRIFPVGYIYNLKIKYHKIFLLDREFVSDSDGDLVIGMFV